MEAANLGAWLSGRDGAVLDEALAALARVPSYRPAIGAWADAGFAVRDRFPGGAESLGIPTWHYGHEPPNVFATAIAKYFRNATREAILLEVCDGGIVFLPGAAGTVQEVFQDACENYYADESAVAPMVLVGREHWTETVPAWPLLHALARGRTMAQRVHLVDTVDEAAQLLGDYSTAAS
jgi:predicted Rossmann-fold nucleotide-binding protein